MGHEPLGLPPYGKLNTRLPWPALGNPRPETLSTLSKKTAWQPCSVRRAWEAVTGAVKILWKLLQALLGLRHPAYPICPVTQHACQAKLLTGDSNSENPASDSQPSPQSSSSRHNDTKFISILLWMPLLGPGVPVPGTLQSTCGPFQLAAGPTDVHASSCDGIFDLWCNDGLSRSVDREVKARKFADAMWSRTCTPCSGVWMRESLVYGLLLIV
eukprot:41830-Pelagomonas_calceolata.AAC.1